MGFSYNGVSRATVEDDTALLLAGLGSFRKETMRLLRKGSDASRILHLYYKHGAVQCARLHLESGHRIMVSPVDDMDQFIWTQLQIAADLHPARRIELLLSKNARTDLVDGRSLLENRRVHVEWCPNNSISDPVAYLLEMEVGEVADRYAMQGRVTALAMLLLLVEAKISAPVCVVIDGIRTKRSIYSSVVDEVLPNGDALARDGNERKKAPPFELQLPNQFGALSWRDYQIYNISLPPLLRAAKVGDMKVIKMPLMGDIDVNEADPEGNIAHCRCLNGTASTQEPSIAWLLLKNDTIVFQGNKLNLKPVHSAAAKGNYDDLQDGDSTSHGSLLDEITVSTAKLDLVDFSTRKSHLVEFPPTRKLDLLEPGTKKFDLIESRALRKLDAFKAGPTRKLDFIGSKPLACVDSVESASIQSESTQFFIKSWRQGSLSFQVSLNEPFHSVMKMVKEKTSFRHSDDYISYMNKVVHPDLPLRLYGIEKDCTININARMRGGHPPFTSFVAENKKNFTTLIILPDGNLGLKISTFGCQFFSSLVSCFIFTFSKRKSWDGQYAWDTHFKIRDNMARIAKQASGGLTSSSMVNDINPLVEFIKDTFSSTDIRLQNKYPPYLEIFISYLKGLKVLTSVDKLILETAVCYMEPYDRMTLTIMLKRKHEGLRDDPDRRIWGEVIAKLPKDNWSEKLGKLIMIEDVIESASNRNQAYSMTGFCSFRLERDICIHGLRQRNKSHPDGKPGDKKIEMFQDNDGVELMIPSHMGDILHKLVVGLIRANVDITRELTHSLVRSKEPSSPVVPVSDSVPDDYIPTWMRNRKLRVTEAGASSSSQSKRK